MMLADTHHPLLTHEQEITLARRVRAGDRDAADELARHNLRLVKKVARRYFSTDPAVNYDDLVAAGMAGLAHAINKFDPARGRKFSTYATWWIRQHIQRLIATTGQISRPAHPADSMKTEAYREAHRRSHLPLRELDAPLINHKGIEGDTLADLIAAPGAPVEDQVLDAIELDRLLAALYDSLNPRGKAIITDWLSGMPRNEAQHAHGVSHSWIDSTLKARKIKLENLMSRITSTTCLEPGCDRPRMVSSKGITLPRCEQHQRAYWNTAAAARRQAEVSRADAPPRRGRPPRSAPAAQPEPSANGSSSMPSLVETVAVPDTACHTACDDCLYREVVALLAEKQPKVAELVAALEAVRRLREDLRL